MGCGKKPEKTAEAPRKVTFYTDWYPQAELGGFYTAALQGYWKELNLEVEIIPGGPGGGQSNMSVNKRVALKPDSLGVMSGQDLIAAIGHDLPLIGVYNQLQHDVLSLIVHAESPVKGFADLEGRKISCIPGTAYVPCLVKKYGIKKLTTTPTTGSTATFLVDPTYIMEGFATYQPYLIQKAGQKSRVLLISDSGFDPYRVLGANLKLVQDHPDWVADFARGAYKGWQSYYKDPKPAHDLMLRENPDATPDFLDYAYHELKKRHFVEGDPAKGETMGANQDERWETTARQLAELGVIPQALPASKLFTNAFTPQSLHYDPTLP
jgi:NitT/TauT family transport system substrate-binding protein